MRGNKRVLGETSNLFMESISFRQNPKSINESTLSTPLQRRFQTILKIQRITTNATSCIPSLLTWNTEEAFRHQPTLPAPP